MIKFVLRFVVGLVCFIVTLVSAPIIILFGGTLLGLTLWAMFVLAMWGGAFSKYPSQREIEKRMRRRDEGSIIQ